MYYSGFQSNAFQSNAFQIIGSTSPAPIVLLPKGGLKKERTHNRSFKQTVKESLEELLSEPKVAEQVQEIVSEYSNSKNLSLSSIDFKLLSQNVAAAERIIMLAQQLHYERLEAQREREDEEAILLLM
jgi:long-subunit acyl-CoA synthetase (AMP-forming)